MYDVVALGELLIDFTPYGESENGNILFERNPGGAPANVLAMLGRLGLKTSFITKVGADKFGEFLKDTLIAQNIDTSGLVFSEKVNTTLAFVHLHPDGDRSFSFYRNPGADLTLELSEVKMELIEKAKVFHFGSLSMTSEPSRQATIGAVQYAKEKGLLITYDPNLRKSLWNDLEEAKRMISEGLHYADVVKLSEDELHFLTDPMDFGAGSEFLMKKYGISLMFVTLGEKGCFYRYKDTTGVIPGYQEEAVDTTGAGDAFFGAAIYKLLEQSIVNLDIKKLDTIVRFANAAGALATTKKGGIPSLPKLADIHQLQEGMK